MSKEPTDDPKSSPKTSDFPIARDQVDRHIADAGEMADRDFERFGWNKAKPKPKRRARKPR